MIVLSFLKNLTVFNDFFEIILSTVAFLQQKIPIFIRILDYLIYLSYISNFITKSKL